MIPAGGKLTDWPRTLVMPEPGAGGTGSTPQEVIIRMPV